ncbi:NAD(P)-dependent alcohol dehydrogenase [Myxococcota bacterium]|nr:NAD(P)-dependent alcohol dehydrogenase [Myxococcota bacterium]MBU1430232.1 NAD(P)-dependent alcohol dehydrogenase [Myxococcota bacterium]MBU1898342.1 NAD(P)-dependent alcohol dehydrogenase [Myxococcota bacterium]
MQAITYTAYGPSSVMRLTEIPKPSPQPGEVVVQAKAASINPIDWKLRDGLMKMMTGKVFPRGMGCDVSGIVTQVGARVRDLQEGDEVFGWIPYKHANAFAEFVVVPAQTLVKKPAHIDFDLAACLPMAGAAAHHALMHKAKIQAGERVLINGCTGGVGLLALQIAKAQGATVIGACHSNHADLARSYGADTVIAYDREDVLMGDARYDVILEASGKLSYASARGILAPQAQRPRSRPGRFLDLNPTPGSMLRGLASRAYMAVMTSVTGADLLTLSELAAVGALRVHINQRIPLHAAVERLAALEARGGGPGKAVIIMSERAEADE